MYDPVNEEIQKKKEIRKRILAQLEAEQKKDVDLLETFAGYALTALIIRGETKDSDQLAQEAYSIAESMIDQRKKKRANNPVKLI